MQTNEKQHKIQNSYRINKILIYRMLTTYVMINLISYCPFWNEKLKTFLKCFRNHDIILLKRLIDITKDTCELPNNRYGGDDRGWMFWLQDPALKFFRLNNPMSNCCVVICFSLLKARNQIHLQLLWALFHKGFNMHITLCEKGWQF